MTTYLQDKVLDIVNGLCYQATMQMKWYYKHIQTASSIFKTDLTCVDVVNRLWGSLKVGGTGIFLNSMGISINLFHEIRSKNLVTDIFWWEKQVLSTYLAVCFS